MTAHVIPPFPVSSVAEELKMNAPTFAEQSAEEEGEELDVDYTMEVIDEEEVHRRSWNGKLIAVLSLRLRVSFPGTSSA